MEPVETESTTEKKRDYRKLIIGVGIGAVAAIVTAVAYNKFSGKEEDFENDYVWTPMPESAETNQ